MEDVSAESAISNEKREKWSRKVEYLLSALGMIVGIGNIWRFPYICMINGGGAFLIPYVIFLVFCGVPAFFLETVLGQFTGKPVSKVWELCPLLKDDVLSLNNMTHSIHHLHAAELEIKETTDSSVSASYLDLLISVSYGKLFTKLYAKRDDFNFRIIPESPAYRFYISQLIRYARACSLYGDLVSRSKSLTAKLIEQGYTKEKLNVNGIGIGMVLMQTMISIYYNTLLGWILYYLYCSFKSPLPWSNCGNDWNTESCMTKEHGKNTSLYINITIATNRSMTNGSEIRLGSLIKVSSPAEEFWRKGVLQISSGIQEPGGVVDHMAIVTLLSYITVYFCICKGIKSVGKVVYVTATLPYLLLLAILIKGLTLPGSLDGIVFYLKPNFEKLLELQVWIQAGIQVFYSSGPGWGSVITMASFNKFNNNCYRDSLIMGVCGEGSSFFAGFVIFSVLGNMAYRSNVTVPEVVTSGPGLAFVAYPEALAQLPFPNVWAILFFLAMFTVGLDSLFALYESIFDAIEDAVPIFGRRSLIFRGLSLMACYLMGLFFCVKGGMYYYQLIDWYVAAIGPFLFSTLACLIVGWIYGMERLSRDITLMIGHGPPLFMRVCWCFITPAILMFLLIFTFVTYKLPSYGEYQYPGFVEIVGWTIAILPVMPIVVIACRQFFLSPGKTIKEKFKSATEPSKDWKPVADYAKIGYEDQKHSQNRTSLLKRITSITCGSKNTN